MRFVGREGLMAQLSKELADVALSGAGRFVVLKGRRRVGKSRLAEEFLRRELPRAVYFSASRQPPGHELRLFGDALDASGVASSAGAIGGHGFPSWEAALGIVAATARPDSPTVVVVDEFPFLLEGDPGVEGTFQKMWDRELSSAPVLLILIGSDLTMMDALTSYGRPLYGRSRVITVPPFSPFEIAEMCDLSPVNALDAYLVMGGFPLIAQSWAGSDIWDFLGKSLADPTSPLIVDGERSLAAEFPADAHARPVFEAIGAGARNFTAVGAVAELGQSSLSRALKVLTEQKRVVLRESPEPPRPKVGRYLVADPYLRFWLRFIGPGLAELERGRDDLVMERIRRSWSAYRGTAIEPIVREAVERRLPELDIGGPVRVGAYWTRNNDVEVDLVIVDESGARPPIRAVGSIKWRDERPFGDRDRDELLRMRERVPGADRRTRLIGVSRTGFTAEPEVAIDAEGVVEAWNPMRGSMAWRR